MKAIQTFKDRAPRASPKFFAGGPGALVFNYLCSFLKVLSGFHNIIYIYICTHVPLGTMSSDVHKSRPPPQEPSSAAALPTFKTLKNK